jgi:Xaa-Pro aminopeptidase
MEGFAERRKRLLDSIRGVAIMASMPAALRNADIEHPYRQDSDLYYFTGFEEPDAVLLLTTAHPEHRAVVFVRPRDSKREQWDGARAGVDGARERLGVDASYPIAELPQRLPDYLMGATELHYQLGYRRGLDEQILAALVQARARRRSSLPRPRFIMHPEETWHEMRLRKSPDEVGIMRQAAAISIEAHLEAMQSARVGQHEYELEAVIRQAFLRRGAPRVAYEPIVASGENATVLHYVSNRRRMGHGELVLIDAACEYGYYASDVTRTFPVSGRFSEPQRTLYEVVLEAQLAALDAVRPGASIDDIHRVTLGVLVQGMLRLGLMRGEVDAIIHEESYKRFYMHPTSHWLGMDVHDVGAYYQEGQSRALEPGMALTIEPGLYVAAHDEEAPLEYRGIGVRIEDALVITADGHENLTAGVPKSVAEVEQACRR